METGLEVLHTRTLLRCLRAPLGAHEHNLKTLGQGVPKVPFIPDVLSQYRQTVGSITSPNLPLDSPLSLLIFLAGREKAKEKV